MKLKNLIFSMILALVLGSPSISGAVAAAPAPAAGIDIYTVGYEFDNIVLTERNGLATPSMLLRIDPTDGSIIEVGDTGFSNCKALDFTPEGVLIANCQRPDPPHTPVLIMLNTETGEGTEIGETGITENISDMSINALGDKFAYEEPGGLHNLHQVNASTGAASFVGTPGIEGEGNAIFFWGALNTLKLVTWADDQNWAFELNTETAQPTLVTNLDMIDLTGAAAEEGPCIVVALDGLGLEGNGELIATAFQIDDTDTRRLFAANLSGYEAVGLAEVATNGVTAAAGIDNRLVGHPYYALSLIDLDAGILLQLKTIEPGYMLDGIALRPPPPRPIPTMSQWGLITASAFLMLAALYFLLRKRQSVNNA